MTSHGIKHESFIDKNLNSCFVGTHHVVKGKKIRRKLPDMISVSVPSEQMLSKNQYCFRHQDGGYIGYIMEKPWYGRIAGGWSVRIGICITFVILFSGILNSIETDHAEAKWRDRPEDPKNPRLLVSRVKNEIYSQTKKTNN